MRDILIKRDKMSNFSLIFNSIYQLDNSASGCISLWNLTSRCLDFGQQSYQIVSSNNEKTIFIELNPIKSTISLSEKIFKVICLFAIARAAIKVSPFFLAIPAIILIAKIALHLTHTIKINSSHDGSEESHPNELKIALDINTFHDLDEWNKKTIIQALSREELRQVFKEYSFMLQYATDEVRNDVEIVSEIVKVDGKTLEHAGEEIKNNKEVVLLAIKSYPLCVKHASEELRKNREVALEAVRRNRYTLTFGYVDKQFLDDDEIVLEALSRDSMVLDVLDKANQRFRDNKRLMLELIERNREDSRCFAISLFSSLSPQLRDDRDLALAAIKRNHFSIYHVGTTLEKDKAFLLEAILVNSRVKECFKDFQLKLLEE